jgi:hypothetical protein
MINQSVDQDGVITGVGMIKTPTVQVLFKKQKEPQSVRIAAEHNKRTRFFYEQGHEQSSGGGVLIARKNQKLWGPDTPEEVADLARSLMTSQGVKKMRKDGIRAIEVLLSLSPRHGINDTEFFLKSMHWFAERFGGLDNLLAADVHRDEANDHIHLLILPLVNGHMIGSEMLGGKGKLKGCKVSFEQEVCRLFGVKVLIADVLKGSDKRRASQAVSAYLSAIGDPVLKSAVWDAVCSGISGRPEPYLHALGFDLEQFRRFKKQKTVAEIFTSPGKGPAKRDRWAQPV